MLQLPNGKLSIQPHPLILLGSCWNCFRQFSVRWLLFYSEVPEGTQSRPGFLLRTYDLIPRNARTNERTIYESSIADIRDVGGYDESTGRDVKLLIQTAKRRRHLHAMLSLWLPYVTGKRFNHLSIGYELSNLSSRRKRASRDDAKDERMKKKGKNLSDRTSRY